MEGHSSRMAVKSEAVHHLRSSIDEGGHAVVEQGGMHHLRDGSGKGGHAVVKMPRKHDLIEETLVNLTGSPLKEPLEDVGPADRRLPHQRRLSQQPCQLVADEPAMGAGCRVGTHTFARVYGEGPISILASKRSKSGWCRSPASLGSNTKKSVPLSVPTCPPYMASRY